MQRLDLRDCGLTELPREVFDLADSLQVLDLSRNRLSCLPVDLPRLHRLRILFCSENDFTELPAVLGRCAELEMVGFKSNRIESIAPGALPRRLRWLILTDNRLTELPAAIADCSRLQKLMLSGNRLEQLPPEIGRCERLELVRLSANAFASSAAALPPELLGLPRLAWLAHAGNPFSLERERQAAAIATARDADWSQLVVGAVLGEGASGTIVRALWRAADGTVQPVALKLFKGAMTSDGLPGSETAAALAAGAHPNLIGVKARLTGHPDGRPGLVLELVPPTHRALAGPPSLDSCSRDVYPEGVRFGGPAALRMAAGVTAAVDALHARGVVHGDVYAHNLMVDDQGDARLGDFGAASLLPPQEPVRSAALLQIEQRACAILLEELAVRCDDAAAARQLRAAAAAQTQAALSSSPRVRMNSIT